MKLYRVAGVLGRTLIALGVLTLLFVAYQLWGTGLQEARAQDRLRDDFAELLAREAVSGGATPTTVAAPEPAPTTTTEEPPPPPPPEGEAVAILKIPRIDVEKVVVEGVGVSDLKKGPGHYPETPLPGQAGNAAIAGHRTTYGAPFWNLDELEPGDPILVTTRQGEVRYEVTESFVVSPSAVEVLAPSEDSRLTLTTCHPRFSARQRLVVVATLVGAAAPAAPPPAVPPATVPPRDGATPTPASSLPGEDPAAGAIDSAGLSGEGASNWPVLAWGAAVGLVALGAWALARAWRRWPAYLLATPLFLVVLFVFFENVSRLLPANV